MGGVITNPKRLNGGVNLAVSLTRIKATYRQGKKVQGTKRLEHQSGPCNLKKWFWLRCQREGGGGRGSGFLQGGRQDTIIEEKPVVR